MIYYNCDIKESSYSNKEEQKIHFLIIFSQWLGIFSYNYSNYSYYVTI